MKGPKQHVLISVYGWEHNGYVFNLPRVLWWHVDLTPLAGVSAVWRLPGFFSLWAVLQSQPSLQRWRCLCQQGAVMTWFIVVISSEAISLGCSKSQHGWAGWGFMIAVADHLYSPAQPMLQLHTDVEQSGQNCQPI
ncbi:hypothetical protein AOLI_G00123020 [Acnodon oligacanthus]